MNEIRPIREPEAESFLRLLCDVFSLDITRARGIFFNEPLFDLNRKWALFEGGEPVSILTTVPLEFGWGTALGIAGVATREDVRRRGLARQLVERVLEDAEGQGVRAAYLFARDPRVYTSIGFEVLDEAVYAPLQGRPEFILPKTLSFDEAREVYRVWSEGNPNRLRRDDRRWSYWKWNLRVCTSHTSGYLCLEGSVVRECVPGGAAGAWPVPTGSEWFGLRSMAAEVGAPISSPRHELYFMGWRSPGMPQMFLTDQF